MALESFTGEARRDDVLRKAAAVVCRRRSSFFGCRQATYKLDSIFFVSPYFGPKCSSAHLHRWLQPSNTETTTDRRLPCTKWSRAYTLSDNGASKKESARLCRGPEGISSTLGEVPKKNRREE